MAPATCEVTSTPSSKPNNPNNPEKPSLQAIPRQALKDGFLAMGTVLHEPHGMPDPERPFVRLAVNPFSLPSANLPIIDQTVSLLAQVFGENNFEAYVISDTDEASRFGQTDLVLGSAGTFRKSLQDGARDLATLISGYFPNPNRGEGAVFVTLKGSGIQTFEDMKGKRAIFLDKNAFSGYAVPLGEIAHRGYDPDHFFAVESFADANMGKELEMLRAGRGDVAAVRTCFIEELRLRGEDTSDLVPIGLHERDASDFRCMSSTGLYPNWTIFSTPNASPATARAAAQALLNMPASVNDMRWGVASDFKPVDELYRTLRRGPYEYLRDWTMKRIWTEYQPAVFGVAALLLALILYALTASRLVRKRTRELEEALQTQKTLSLKAARAVEQLHRMQKAGALNQMSYVIAHELRQPLSAILNFAHGVEKLVDTTQPNGELVTDGVRRIASQARAAEGIVQKVRTYVKRDTPGRISLELSAEVEKALQLVLDAQAYSGVVTRQYASRPVHLVSDPFEIALIVTNLVKNAVEAMEGVAHPALSIRTGEVPTEEGASAMAFIEVENNGQPLSAEALSRLEHRTPSDKPGGLGLGLEIVRLTAASGGGKLFFTPGSHGGLCARVTIRIRTLEEEA